MEEILLPYLELENAKNIVNIKSRHLYMLFYGINLLSTLLYMLVFPAYLHIYVIYG